jgi:hypothetical protein
VKKPLADKGGQEPTGQKEQGALGQESSESAGKRRKTVQDESIDIHQEKQKSMCCFACKFSFLLCSCRSSFTNVGNTAGVAYPHGFVFLLMRASLRLVDPYRAEVFSEATKRRLESGQDLDIFGSQNLNLRNQVGQVAGVSTDRAYPMAKNTK